MGRDIIVAFDDIVHGTSNVYSSSFIELALGELESLALQVVAEPLTNPSDNVTVQIETSADGRNWVSKNSTAEVFLTTPSGTTSSTFGFDPGLIPSLALVRLRVKLGGTSNCSARIAIYAREGPNLGFLPARLSGCVLWLRADLGITLNGSNVSQWSDQSGSANHATQATSSRQPPYNVRQINGRPTVYFDPTSAGSEKYMALTSSLASLTAAHAFVVHRRITATESTGSRTGFWKMGTSAGTSAMPGTDGNIYDDCATTSNNNCGAPVVALTTSQVYEVQSGATWRNLCNGSSQFNAGASTVSASSTPQIGGNSAWPNFYYGDWAEMILYNRLLSTAERSRVISYLNNLYALGAT